jgi:hypothetical protein
VGVLPSDTSVEFDITQYDTFGEVLRNMADKGPNFGFAKSGRCVEPGAIEYIRRSEGKFYANFLGLYYSHEAKRLK